MVSYKNASGLADLSLSFDSSSVDLNQSFDDYNDTTLDTSIMSNTSIEAMKLQVPVSPLPQTQPSIKKERAAKQDSTSAELPSMLPPRSQISPAKVFTRQIPGLEETHREINASFQRAAMPRRLMANSSIITQNRTVPQLVASSQTFPSSGNQSVASQAAIPSSVPIKTEGSDEPFIRFPGELVIIDDDDDDATTVPKSIVTKNAAEKQVSTVVREEIQAKEIQKPAAPITNQEDSLPPNLKKRQTGRRSSEPSNNFPNILDDGLGSSDSSFLPIQNYEIGNEVDDDAVLEQMSQYHMNHREPSTLRQQAPPLRRNQSHSHSLSHSGNFGAANLHLQGGTERDDMDLIHSILNKKFHEAKARDAELLDMHKVIYDIADKLSMIGDKDQEITSLRDRCSRLQDSLDQYRGTRAGLNEEIDKLRFQLQTARDELARKNIDAANNIARIQTKLDMSNQIISRLQKSNNDASQDFKDLKYEQDHLKKELANILKCREDLVAVLRKRDEELENFRTVVRECTAQVNAQTEKYNAIREKCAQADEVFHTNKTLKLNLRDKEEALTVAKASAASLREKLDKMTSNISDLRESMDTYHGTITQQISGSTEKLDTLFSLQGEQFFRLQENLSQLLHNSENPDPEILMSLRSIVDANSDKWDEITAILANLRKDQQTTSDLHLEKMGKWKVLKETLNTQISIQTEELREKEKAISSFEHEIENLKYEVTKAKELNASMVATHEKEKTLLQTKLTELGHEHELAKSHRSECEARLSVAQSRLDTTKMELSNENELVLKLQKELEREKSRNKELRAQQLEAVEKLKTELQNVANGNMGADKLQKELEEALRGRDELQSSLREEKNRAGEALSKLAASLEQLKIKDQQLTMAAKHLEEVSVKHQRAENELKATKIDAQLYSEQSNAQSINYQDQLKRNNQLSIDLLEKENIIRRFDEKLNTAQAKEKEACDKLQEREETLSFSKSMREKLKKELDVKNIELERLRRDLTTAQKDIEELKKATKKDEDKDAEIVKLKSTLAAAEKSIAELQSELARNSVFAAENSEIVERVSKKNTNKKERMASDTNGHSVTGRHVPNSLEYDGDGITNQQQHNSLKKPTHYISDPVAKQDLQIVTQAHSLPAEKPSSNPFSGWATKPSALQDKGKDAVTFHSSIVRPKDLENASHNILSQRVQEEAIAPLSTPKQSGNQPGTSRRKRVCAGSMTKDGIDNADSAVMVTGTPDDALRNAASLALGLPSEGSIDEVALIPATQFSNHSSQAGPQNAAIVQTSQIPVLPTPKKRVHFDSQTIVLASSPDQPLMLYNHAKTKRVAEEHDIGKGRSKRQAVLTDEGIVPTATDVPNAPVYGRVLPKTKRPAKSYRLRARG